MLVISVILFACCPFLGPPLPPTITSVSVVSDSEIRIAWRAADNCATSFIIERKTETTDWVVAGEVSATTFELVDSTLRAVTEYEYRVRATNSSGSSDALGTVTITTENGPPAAVDEITVTPKAGGTIEISWHSNAHNATGIRIERVRDADGAIEMSRQLDISAILLTDDEARDFVDYRYVIIVFNEFGDSAESGSSVVSTHPFLEMTSLPVTDGSGDLGHSVAAYGNTIVAGAPGWGSSGRIVVFSRSQNAWIESQTLDSTDATAGSRFGDSIDIDSDSVIVGAPHDGAPLFREGAVYVSERIDGTLNAFVKLVTPGLSEESLLGSSVAISVASDGTRLAFAGAPNAESGGVRSGVVLAFRYAIDEWIFESTLVLPDPRADDRFGSAIRASGEVVYIGSPGRDAVSWNEGAVYVFTRIGVDDWEQAALPSSGMSSWDGYGSALAVTEDTIAVGIPFSEHDSITPDAGSWIVYNTNDTSLFDQFTVSGAVAGDRFGGCLVAYSGLYAAASWNGDIQGLAFADGEWKPMFSIRDSDDGIFDVPTSLAMTDGYLVAGFPNSTSGSSNNGQLYVYR